MSEANEITANLLIKIPERFPNVVVWRNNRVKAMAMGRGGKMRMISAGIDGQGDISGLVGPSGRRLEVEVKAGNDKLSEDQINFREMILAHGGIYVEARSAEQGIQSLEQSMQSEELNGVHGLQSVAEIVNAAGGVDRFFEKARTGRRSKPAVLPAPVNV